MTSVFAVFALHTSGVFQKIAAKRTSHNVVKLLRYKLVPIHLMDNFLTLTDGSFSVEAEVKRPAILGLLNKAEGEMNLACRFQ